MCIILIFMQRRMIFLNPNYLKEKENDMIFIGTLMEAYIPQYYFEKELAVEYGGDYIKLMGLFNFMVFADEEGARPVTKLETFNLPTMINVYPTSFETRNISLIKGTDPEPYTVLKFFNGDIVTKMDLIQDSANCELFLRMKIPQTVPYNEIINVWRTNMSLNGTDMPDIPSVVFEIVMSEKYRDPKNPEKRFGEVAGANPSTSMTDYLIANFRDICKYNSIFSSVTFEDFDTMVGNALNVSRTKRKQIESPVEKIMKY